MATAKTQIPQCPSRVSAPDPKDPKKTIQVPGCPKGKPLQVLGIVTSPAEIVTTWQCPQCCTKLVQTVARQAAAE